MMPGISRKENISEKYVAISRGAVSQRCKENLGVNVMGGFKRADRVADLIKKEMSDIFVKQVHDPRIGIITITGVKVADDLRSAKIFFVELGKNRCSDDVKRGLQKASGFLRRELGQRLRLRYVPELFFNYDPSFAYGERIEELITEIHQKEGGDVSTDR
jgi:ribosome-binding factor A